MEHVLNNICNINFEISLNDMRKTYFIIVTHGTDNLSRNNCIIRSTTNTLRVIHLSMTSGRCAS